MVSFSTLLTVAEVLLLTAPTLSVASPAAFAAPEAAPLAWADALPYASAFASAFALASPQRRNPRSTTIGRPTVVTQQNGQKKLIPGDCTDHNKVAPKVPPTCGHCMKCHDTAAACAAKGCIPGN